MYRQMQVVSLTVRVADDLTERLLRIVAVKFDPAGGQIRLHRVGDQVHVVFLGTASYIAVELLRGRTEIDFRHKNAPFLDE